MLIVDIDTLAHFYSPASGPDDWEFVMVGESFVVMYEVSKSPEGEGWKSVVALTNSGTIAVLSFPIAHNFRII